MIKKKIVVLIISFFLLFSNLNVYAIVGVSDKYFVNDYANLLSNNTEEYIVNCSSFLKENVNSEIVVVTVNNLENISIEEYSDTLYEQYNIGDYTDNKSILILVSLEERTVRVKVGSGLSNYFTDNLINSYIEDYFAPYFKENNWEYGIKNGYSAFCKTICDIYGVDADSMIVENGGTFFYEYKVEILIFCILFVMFSCNYFTKFLVRKYKDKITTEYYEEALFYIVVMIDSFIFYYYLVFDIKYFLILLGFFVVSIIGCVDFDNTKKKKKIKKKKGK